MSVCAPVCAAEAGTGAAKIKSEGQTHHISAHSSSSITEITPGCRGLGVSVASLCQDLLPWNDVTNRFYTVSQKFSIVIERQQEIKH